MAKKKTEDAIITSSNNGIKYSATEAIKVIENLFQTEIKKSFGDEKIKNEEIDVNVIKKMMDDIGTKYLTKVLGFKAKPLIEIVISNNGIKFYYDGFIAGDTIKEMKNDNVKVIDTPFIVK